MSEARNFTQDEIRTAMRINYDTLIAFVTSAPFKSILADMDEMDAIEKNAFIKNVLLNSDALTERGVEVPEGVLIQRSAFGDRRPTLFCVKKYLPAKFHSAWENVNLTFDAEGGEATTRDPKDCWRNPIAPDLQSALLAAGLALDEIPAAFQVDGSLMRERWLKQPDAA